MRTLKLKLLQASTAVKIQQAIDQIAESGGCIVLPEMDITLDRGIELRSNVELVGQGERTVLRKGPGRIYPLAGYHNYGMCDVPLLNTEGLAAGMTVSIQDNECRGFYETFARITWVENEWVGLDHGIEADYHGIDEPRLTTAYPVVFGHGIQNAAVRDLAIDGRRKDQDAVMGACRGACVYLAKSRNIEISGIREQNFHGEGLGFQMCRDIRVRDCHFNANTGNGLHPGSGSTDAIFENCVSVRNEMSGFFFCVRANHITVKECEFKDNGSGVSIGARDCNNLIESCRIQGNKGPGILVREGTRPCEVHSCMVRNCRVEGNAAADGEGQVVVLGDAHDLLFEKNHVAGSPKSPGTGIFVAPTARNICCIENEFDFCETSVQADSRSLTTSISDFKYGYGTASEQDARHLEPLWELG